MTDALAFTEEEIRIIKGLYTAADSAARRQFVRDALELQSGEAVLSIGCGPGFETAGLAEPVGTDGRVLGIDPGCSNRLSIRGWSISKGT